MKGAFDLLTFLVLMMSLLFRENCGQDKEELIVELLDNHNLNMSLVTQGGRIRLTFKCAGSSYVLYIKRPDGKNYYTHSTAMEKEKVLDLRPYRDMGNYSGKCHGSSQEMIYQHLYRTCSLTQMSKAHKKCRDANINACLYIKDDSQKGESICNTMTRELCDKVHSGVKYDSDLRMCTGDDDLNICHSLVRRNKEKTARPFYSLVKNKEDCTKTAFGHPIYSLLIFSPEKENGRGVTCQQVYEKDKKQLRLLQMSEFAPVRRGFFRACVVTGTDRVQISIVIKTNKAGLVTWISTNKYRQENMGEAKLLDYGIELKPDEIQFVKVGFVAYQMGANQTLGIKASGGDIQRGPRLARFHASIVVGGFEVKPKLGISETCGQGSNLLCKLDVDPDIKLPFEFLWKVNTYVKGILSGESPSNIFQISELGLYECHIRAVLRNPIFANDNVLTYKQFKKFKLDSQECLSEETIARIKESKGGGSDVFLHLAIALGGILVGGIFLLMCIFLARKTRCGTIGPFSWFSDKSASKRTKKTQSITFSS